MSVTFEKNVYTPRSNTGVTPQDRFSIFKAFNGSLVRLPSVFDNEMLPQGFELVRHQSTSSSAALIDTISFTLKSKEYYKAFPSSPALTSDGEDLVEDISNHLENVLGFGVSAPRLKGINFYDRSYSLGSNWGFLAIGGINQKDSIQIYLNGHGCMMALDGWEKRLKDFIDLIGGSITRIDLAADYFDDTYTVHKALEDHLAGAYKVKNAPANPKGEKRGCWDYEALGIRNDGLTYCIGSRETGKFFRVYQKGYEQAGKLKDSELFGGLFLKQFEKWTRIELELSNKSRVIPTDVLINAGQYLAGSVPALEFISKEQKHINVMRKTVKAAVSNVKNWLKKQVGKSLYGLLLFERESDSREDENRKIVEIFRALMTEETPKWFKVYEDPKPMSFFDSKDKREDESDSDFIERTFPDLAKTMNQIIKKKEDKFRYAF